MLIQEKLKEKQDFSDVEILIADYLLDNKENIAEQSARFIASQVYTAPSTVVRLCQKIGYQGFNDFKKAYLEETAYLQSHFNEVNPNYPFNYHDQGKEIAYKIKHLYNDVLGDAATLLDKDVIAKITKILNAAKNIYICSSGVQADIAKTFKDKMLRIGKNVIVESKMDQAYYLASFSSNENVFLMISYSGETEVLLRVAHKLKERKIPFIALTSYGDSTLHKLANETVYVCTREKLNENLGDFGMNLSVLYILDILYATVFNENYKQNFENKVIISHEFQINRNTQNPILKDSDK